MRILLGLLLSLALGTALGGGLAVWHLGWPTEVAAFTAVTVEGEQPRAVLDKELHDFGPVDANSQQGHPFRVTNAGTAPLRLLTRPEDSSCRCTIGSIEKGVLMPGESGAVTVRWNGKGHVHPFRESAVVRTNDPRRPRIELLVSGLSVHPVTASPEEVLMTAAPDQPASAELRLYAYGQTEPLTITEIQLTDASSASFVELSETPLTGDALTKEQADSGQLVRLQLKPGLPPGSIRQTIRISHNLSTEPLEIPLHLDLVQDITMTGTGWDKAQRVLNLGEVGPEGVTRNLDVFVRGDNRHDFQLKLVSAEPNELKVEIKKSAELGDRITRVPLRVMLQPNAMGTDEAATPERRGRIVLETSHVREKQLEFEVRWTAKKP